MSAHDPFDGIYGDAAPTGDKSEVTVVAPDDVDVQVVGEDESSSEVRHLGKTELARMDKADLQAAARDRGLDDSGSRTELQERLRDYQGD